jgi:hypothetical protein
MTKTAKIILGIVGGLFLLCLIVVSFGVWMFMSAIQTEEVDQQQATAAFDEARARFAGIEPAFEMRDNRPVIARQPPLTATSPPPQSVHILTWEPDEGRIARIRLPFSVLRWGDDDIEFDGVSLAVEDVERYGRTLLFDGDSPDGDRVLVWTD